MKKILYSTGELNEALRASRCIVVDCRFNLVDTGAGYKAYLDGHIPGAAYAHLDDDLSSPITATTGRHPLPAVDSFAAFLARIGWSRGIPLVAYDDAGGAIAARLWWLMKYFGHDCGALLDGGLPAWREAGLALERGAAEAVKAPLVALQPQQNLVLSAGDVTAGLQQGTLVLADARAPERFRGEVEPLDTVAGHIPGACNFPNAALK